MIERQLGRLMVGASKVIQTSPNGLAVAYDGLRPILPGHAIVAPARPVARLCDLTADELDSLFCTVRSLQSLIGPKHGATAFNLAVHDGAAAGQPTLLPHVHVHVVPRQPGDLAPDAIYNALDRWSPEGPETVPPPFHVPSDEERHARTAEQMAAEADSYAAAAAGFDFQQEARPTSPIHFAKIELAASQIFFARRLTVAVVNLKPLCPGHVLVIPRRSVPTMAELDDDEHADLWATVRQVQAIVEACHGASASKLGVQDGKAAGQSVPHVHVHILPQPPQPATAGSSGA